MKKIRLLLLIITGTSLIIAQTSLKRSRGEGLYKCISANTIGVGNIWAQFRALGFLWDSNPENENIPEPFAFPEIDVEVGIRNYVSLQVSSRLVSYSWKYDWFCLNSKWSFLDNKDIKLHTIGALCGYEHRVLKKFSSSIAGFHNGEGSGFCPEGFITKGGRITLQVLYDIDLLPKFTWLPIKIMTNLGISIPVSKTFRPFSQYVFNCGVAYTGLGADVFIEYSIKAFVNKNTEPKNFDFYWPGWYNDDLKSKTWEVAFSENPMYLTLGGRIRYDNGMGIYGAIPLLLSKNRGSAMTDEDRQGLKHGKFPDELRRGISDPFDPWYPKWKIVVSLSYPIRYKRTSAEMHRNFLLLKNKKTKTKIDIDKRLEIENEESKRKKDDEEEERKKRLEEIEKRRKKFETKE